MSIENPFTKENLDECLRELGKEFRKVNGNKMPAEIILVGGAAILAKYGFRDLTYDMDAIIIASSAMKDAIRKVADIKGLPPDWLNSGFKHTDSYSDKIIEISRPYKTFSNVLHIRVVSDEYLVAMKLMSGREYKRDLSDIVGIMWELDCAKRPLTKESIEKAFYVLYGETKVMPEMSQELFENIFTEKNYEALYKNVYEKETQLRESLKTFEKHNPDMLRKDNIKSVIAAIKEKQRLENTVPSAQQQKKKKSKTKSREAR